MEEIYSLKELENMELEDYHPHHLTQLQHHDGDKSVILSPPNHYRPPALGYLPPDPRGHTHLSKDHMNLGQSYELPSKSYLPPKVHPDLGEENHMMYFSPPIHGYLPPTHGKTPKALHASLHYLPPSHDYKKPRPGPTYPSKEYSTRVEFQDFQPPSKEYLPPAAGRYSSKLEVKEPTHDIKRQGANHISKSEDPKLKPSQSYLPPKMAEQEESSMEHYKPPSKDYLPPTEEDLENEDDLPNRYSPPKSDYLPPGKPAHPYEVKSISTEDPKEFDNPGNHLKPPTHGYIPPQADKAAGKHEHLKPPSNDYLPPKAKDSKLGTHYKPPSHGYLPPEKTEEEHHLQSHFEAPSKDYLPPKAESQPEESHENLKPPNKKYLPPKKEKKVLGSHYEPPSHGYLPPKAQDGINVNNHYEMPNHEYLPPDNNKLDDTGQHLKPPSVEYLPPKGEYKGSETDYQPLSVDYLPPTVKETKQINDHYAVPSHDYLPPQDSKENNDHLHLKPPSGEYLPPKGNVPNVGIHYEPPSHGYLPPDSGRKDDTHQHLRPPSGEYLPPKGKVPDIGTHYQPPSHGYLPPQKNLEDDSHQHLEPPSGEYLPPKGNNYEIDTHYQPPSQGYLPPGNKEKDDARQHLEPPSGEYLPPKGKVPDIGTHYQVPSHGYLPPKSSAQDESHQHFKPPSGEYLPPKINGPEIGNHYQPPSQDHLPPKSEAQNHQINDHYETPTHDYLPPKKEKSEHQHLKPPSGEYLPPKGADPEIGTHYKPTSHKYLPPQGKDYSSPDTDTPPKYDQHLKPPSSGYLPPRKEGSKLDALLSPPSHGYLPPNNYEPDHHDDHASNNAHLKPPSSDYLPPKEVEHVGKAQANYSDLKPPSHDYLPPKEVNHVTVTPHSISVSEQYQPSSPGTTPYHVPPSYPTGAPEAQSISIEPNILINGKSYKLDVPGSTAVTVGPNNHHQNALPPHSINIQINIPNKDEFTIGKGIQGLGGSHFHSPEMEDKNYAPKVPEYRPGSPAVEYSGPGEEFNHHESKPSYYPDHETYDDGYGYGFNLPKPQYHNTKDHPPRKYISTKDHLRNYNPQYLPTVPKNLPYPPYLPPSPFPSGPEDGSYLFGYENKDNLYHPPGSQYLPPIDSSIVHPRLLPHTGNGRPNDGPPKLPNYHSHHVENSPDETLSPPKGSYLPPDDYVPPPTPDNYIPPPSEVPSESNGYIPPPPKPPSASDDYLPPRVEGAKPDYIPPPPRDVLPEVDDVDADNIPEPPSPDEISAQQVLNSQTLPPSSSSDHYIPPKTMHDIPKNFLRPEDVPEEIPEEILEPPAPTEIDAETISEPSEPPEPFLGLAKLTNGSGLEESNEPKLPPMPTLAPPQPDKFLPLLRELSPDLLKKLGISVNRPNPNAAQANFIPGVPGKDYPDFKSIPPTAFSCENFILEGFYADTFTSCQAFHVCESGKRQSSFLCPRGTIFNQKHRVCDWWYNVKCEDSAEFYDLNLDLILLENKKNRATLSVPPPIDPFSVAGVDSNLLSGLESDSSLLGGFGAQLLNSIGMMNVMNGIDRSDNGQSLDTSKLRIRNRPTKTPLINSLKAPSDDLFKGKQGSFVNKLSDLNQNDIDDMTSDELSKLANSLATLEQLSKDLEHFDDNEMKELLSRKANPPSRLPNNKFLPRSGRIGQPIVASRRSNEAEEESALSESRKASVASSLCEFMNICDNLESSPETHRNYPAKELSETSIDSKIVNPLPVSVETTANPFLRTGEKTASEIAALVAKTKAYLKEKPFDLDVAGSEIREHSVIRTPKLETDNEFRLSDDNMDLDVTTWNPTTSHAFTESQTDVSSSSDWTPIRSLN
ncbi:titin-like [Tigriopus californicus]|uniref:titin-like n=1 Tax=Tigriopus californicus TaxID=6832 RepID=UPI0027D9F394|nr:titin-like [Tigriopus californicus]